LKLYVVIPVKALREAKARLASIMSHPQRRELCLCMFRDVTSKILRVKNVKGLVIVTSDPEIAEISRSMNAKVLIEKQSLGVNQAVLWGINYCLGFNASAILILPADVPLISEEDVEFLVRLGLNSPSAVICPSVRFDGTNALLLNPPRILETSYDFDSFRSHLTLGFGRRVNVKVYLSPRLMLDIDTPEDLRVFMSMEAGKETETYGFCLKKLGWC
jgi:2-phospho-L-lactate guanylyltransferase